jgi:hypothetical protein
MGSLLRQPLVMSAIAFTLNTGLFAVVLIVCKVVTHS